MWRRKVRKESPMESPNGRILVIRFSSLGDLVLMLPLLSALRKGFPESTIDLATKAEYAGLFEDDTDVDSVITLDSDDLAGLIRLRRKLSGKRYDTVIDAHGVIRSDVLSFTLRAGRKMRIRKDQAKKTILIKGKRNLYSSFRSMKERYLDLAERLGIENPDPDASMTVGHEALSKVEKIIDETELSGRKLAAIAPGARWRTKRWPKERFREVLEKLTARGFGVVVIGDGSDWEEASFVAGDTSLALNLAGRLSIKETAAALKKCSFLVTNDSAPLHISEAVGTPVIAIFGPTVKEFGFFPHMDGSVALERDLECRPCSRNGSADCNQPSRVCLESIGAQEVLDAAERILAEL